MVIRERNTDKNQNDSLKNIVRNTNLPTAMEIQILDYLSEKRGRATNIATGLDLNQKSIWQAIQRGIQRGFISRDEFDIYSITESGKQWMQEDRESFQVRKSVLAFKIENNDHLTLADIEKLEGIYNKSLEGRKKGQ